MDVDHAGEPILMIGDRDETVTIGTLTDLVTIRDIAGMTAIGILTGTVTGDIEIETGTAREPGVAAARRSHSSCTAP
jgi:hypothetical protein